MVMDGHAFNSCIIFERSGFQGCAFCITSR